jgi:hypothetical protein
MGQPPNPARLRPNEIERKLLASLCQPALPSETRAMILARLNGHVFAEPDHQVIYRALATVPPMDSAEMPQALMQAVTRLGFPDLEFGWLFTEVPAENSIPALLESL